MNLLVRNEESEFAEITKLHPLPQGFEHVVTCFQKKEAECTV